MPIKIGTTSIKVPFSRVYVGDDLVYIAYSPYLTKELGDILTTELGDALEITIGMYVDELDNQIITEDGKEWEVE